MRGALVFFAASLALLAQYPGQYPYPGGGRYPGGGGVGGVGIPRPRRGSKTEKQPDQPLPSFAGILKQIDSKTITVELGDSRVMEFRRSSKTKFIDVKDSALKAGDHVSIEATEDAGGFLNAVTVRLEATAGGETAGDSKKTPEPSDKAPAAASGPAPAPAGDSKKTPESAEKAPAAAPAPAPSTPARSTPARAAAPDDDSARVAAENDPDRPKIRRGIPPKRKSSASESEEPVETASAAPPRAAGPAAAAAAATPATSPGAPARTEPPASTAASTAAGEDAVIEKARTAAETFTETLPNYVVQEFMARYQSETSKPDWRPLDVVSSDVVYENKRESYRNLKINGKPIKEGMEQLTGSWSTGEFGTILRNLLAPMTAAHFHLRKQTSISGRTAIVYGYDVDRENSTWLVKVGSQSIEPAYRGAIWIDKETARVLRIEMEAVELPDAFPLDKVEMAADYGPTRLGTTAEYILPTHAETLSCQRGTSVCSRNQIDFRNYHKYSGESSITFEK